MKVVEVADEVRETARDARVSLVGCARWVLRRVVGTPCVGVSSMRACRLGACALQALPEMRGAALGFGLGFGLRVRVTG